MSLTRLNPKNRYLRYLRCQQCGAKPGGPCESLGYQNTGKAIKNPHFGREHSTTRCTETYGCSIVPGHMGACRDANGDVLTPTTPKAAER